MNLFYDFLSCDETLNLTFCRPVFRALNKLPDDFITACIDPVILWGNLWIQTELPAMANYVPGAVYLRIAKLISIVPFPDILIMS